MSSALFFTTHDEHGEVSEIFQEYELAQALASFLVATYENEYAELRWSR